MKSLDRTGFAWGRWDFGASIFTIKCAVEGPVGRIVWGRCGDKKSTFPKGVTDLPQMIYRMSAEKLADGGFKYYD